MTSRKHEHTTWGFVQAGFDVQTSAVCIAVLWFGLDGILLGFQLLSCTFISLLGFSSGLDNQQCPACTKPCSLGAIKNMHSRFKMAIKKIFTKSWRICYILYLVVFFFSLSGVIITADEYEGGSKLAEFGSSIFVIFTFPIFFLYEQFNGTYSSNYDFLVLILFLINFLINSFLLATLLNLLFLKLKGIGNRLYQKG